MITFKSLGISNSLLRVLETQNYINPYPIQKKAIPAILNKKDILGIAKTGSGKTASYLLPILMNLSKKIEEKSFIKKNRVINVLILVPTRELAVQVNDLLQIFIKGISSKIKSLAVFGGVSINVQMQSIGNTNILVATPGRLIKLVESNAVHLSSVELLVLDEADKILSEGFAEEIDKILNMLPKKRQNLLFSATLNERVSNINKIVLKDPIIIKIESKKDDIELIDQLVYFVEEEKKGPLLRYLIISKNMSKVLIFTSSITRANRVTEKLRKNGIKAEAIHSKKSQGARVDLLTKFKNGKISVLVTTDLLARGIDIELLPFIINYELPRSPKMFIHRIGRTGRAESFGEAITLVTPKEEHHFKVIEKKMKRYVKRVDISDLNLHGY